MPDQEKMDAFAELKMLRQTIAAFSPNDPELAAIDDMLGKLRARQYTVAVVGEFNRGKSSLINALLGMSVLPADITPTTATVNRVVYSETPYVRLHMRNGKTEGVSMSMLKDRVTKLSAEAQSAAEAVKEAEIGYPTVFCKNNVAILDTPGLNDCAEMDALTFSKMEKADALIYAIHALIPFSDSEAEAVCRLLNYPNIRHILFTVGFIDQIPLEERERVLAVIQKRILRLTKRKMEEKGLDEADAARRQAILEGASIVGVSAKMALDAFVTGSQAQLTASCIEEFKKLLMARLTAQQDEWLSYEILPYLKNQAGAFGGAAERALIAMDQRIENAQEEIGSAKEQLDALLADAERMGKEFCSQVDSQAGTKEERTGRLQQVILEECRLAAERAGAGRPAAEESRHPLADEFNASSKAGFFSQAKNWVKKKVMEKDLFRESGDPMVRGLEEGFWEARGQVISQWVPALEQAAKEAYAGLSSLPSQAEGAILAAMGRAAELIGTGEVKLPSRLMDEPLNGEPFVLMTEDAVEALRQLQPGNLKIGTQEWIAQREAASLSGAFATLAAARAAAAEQAVMEKAKGIYEAGLAQSLALDAALEKLKEEKEELKAQIAATQKMLSGSGGEGQEGILEEMKK